MTVPNETFDALIVGGGIVGAACARELALNGLQVAILEQNDYLGGGATAAGMGHLAVMDDSEAQFALTRFSQDLWRGLACELPPDAEYLSCGSLWIAADDEELKEVERKVDFYTARDLPVERLDSQQLAEAEPQLRPDLAGALLLPSDSVCYPPCAARFLAEQVLSHGGAVYLNRLVSGIHDDGVRLSDGRFLAAGLVVVAAGTAACRLVPEIDMQPRKGHLLITDRYPGFLRHQVIELGYLKSAHSNTSDSVAFNAQPRITGQILIGSSRQYGVDDGAIESRIMRKMLSRAITYMPHLAGLSAIRGWTGLRASTPDKLPLIGLCPGFERVYLATGHEGLGISTSLATARLLADEILGRGSDIPRHPYQPARAFALHA